MQEQLGNYGEYYESKKTCKAKADRPRGFDDMEIDKEQAEEALSKAESATLGKPVFVHSGLKTAMDILFMHWDLMAVVTCFSLLHPSHVTVAPTGVRPVLSV